jgi:hypothetical protein
MKQASTALLGAGLLLLGACGGADERAGANEAVAADEGVLEPANAADAAEVTPAEANAMDAAIENALSDGEAAANAQ